MKMKSLVFDAGPIISLAVNNLLWILEPMKEQFKGDFLITPAVRFELIDRPIKTKKFKFEAMQVLEQLNIGNLQLTTDRKIKEIANKIYETANQVFMAKGQYLQLVHQGELESIAACIYHDSDALVIDERTTRALIENPLYLAKHMEKRLHTKITINKKNLAKIKEMTKHIRMIRSTEFTLVAYELGLLDKYKASIPRPEQNLLDAVLWGLKLNGCAISKEEIDRLIRAELSR